MNQEQDYKNRGNSPDLPTTIAEQSRHEIAVDPATNGGHTPMTGGAGDMGTGPSGMVTDDTLMESREHGRRELVAEGETSDALDAAQAAPPGGTLGMAPGSTVGGFAGSPGYVSAQTVGGAVPGVQAMSVPFDRTPETRGIADRTEHAPNDEPAYGITDGH